jgi:hypothetical protein
MRNFYLALFLFFGYSAAVKAQTPVPMAAQPGLTYTETFADIANWTTPFTGGTGSNRFTTVATSTTGTIPNGLRTTTSTTAFVTGSSGGIQRGTSQSPATQSIVLLSTGSTDNTSAVAFDVHLDFTGINAGTLSYDWATIFNSTGDRKSSLRVYYSTDGTSFTELTAAQVLNFTNNVATSGSIAAVALPSAFNNSATARLRFYYHNASGGSSGSRPKISIDNITVTANSGAPVTTASVGAGNSATEPATNGTFTINLTAAAPAGGVTVNYILSGTAKADEDFIDPQSGSVTITEGNTSATITLNTIDDALFEPTESIEITLTGASNSYTIATANASIKLDDNDPPPSTPITLSGIYTQDFNTLVNTGTSFNIPSGWLLAEVGTGANTTYSAGTGSGSSGDTYSFGAAGSAERALGSLQSGSVTPSFGAHFTNYTGSTITTLQVTYTGEQWRLGATTREDRLDFQYSLDATNLTTGTWTTVNELDFTAPITAGSTGALDGNLPANQTAITYKITGLSIPVGATFYIKWSDYGASGADDGLAIDDITIEANPLDITPPVITTLTPVNNATDWPTTSTAIITFNETIQKGNGYITIKNASDNSIVRTIAVTDADIAITNNNLSINLSNLAVNTTYYVTIDNSAIEDLSGNDFAGFSSSTTWSFTTGTTLFAADLDACGSSLSNGFTQFSQSGTVVWGCTPFGRDPVNPAGSTAYPNGMQINGFSGGTNTPNVDWLISPSFDLTGTSFPLLSFWSRAAFNGAPLQLKVSTDYTGGDPRLATWTDINGRFPDQASNIWTLSNNINLAALKQANVHFAFVYISTDEDGARWTLDDIGLVNSQTPPPPSITVNTSDIQFTYVASGSKVQKTFLLVGNDLTEEISLTASGAFQLSKDGITYTSSVTYSVAEANNIAKTVFVQFAPTENRKNFTGAIEIKTSSLSSIINMIGTSIDPATTLEVVNWNVEWFGSTAEDPVNDQQQEQNVKTVLQNINADIYALSEVVSETRLASIVSQLDGYDYVISNFGSHTNTAKNSPDALAAAQKLAFVYKKGVFKNVTTTPLLSQGINTAADLSNPAYNDWSSGRFPYMLSADVTLHCVTKPVKFILVHAKANTSPTATSYDRRKDGADSLHYTLQQLYPNDNIVILGDFNDDLDKSITAGFTTTSWDAFTTDAANYTALTLPLSLAGKKSTVSHNDVIDHVVISNEMQPYYMEGTATILSDVTNLVTNYASTTSDHLPVFTRYMFEDPAAPVITVCPTLPATCVTSTGIYTLPEIAAVGVCGAITYSYEVTGATNRSGNTANASGLFNIGTSLINWTVTDGSGKTTTCQTTVVINDTPRVFIPDATVLASGVKENTVYTGYTPAATIALQANAAEGTAPYTYLWSTGTATETVQVNPTAQTTYMVTVTDAFGCLSNATKTINVMDIRGGINNDKVVICHKPGIQRNTMAVDADNVADHLSHGDQLGACISVTRPEIVEASADNPIIILAVPNPSPKHFTITIEASGTENVTLRVMDLYGQVIEQRNNIGTSKTLQLGANYTPGIYILEIIQGTKHKQVRLVKPVVN